MLVGRFFLIIPALAIAGSLVRKQKVPVTAGTFPTDTPLFGGLVVGVVIIVAGLTFFPSSLSAPSSSTSASSALGAPSMSTTLDSNADRPGEPTSRRSRGAGRPGHGSCSTRRSPARPIKDSFVKLNPRTMIRNPVMFVVEVGSVLTTVLFLRDFGSSTSSENVFAGLVGALAVVHRAVRQLRRGDGRGPGQGAGGDAAQDPGRDRGPGPAARRRRSSRSPSPALQLGDLCVVTAGRGDPRRRRRRRGHRHRRRVGHHGRVGTGHPREWRRPLGGHWRHAGAVRRDRRADHLQAGRDVPRPDDRPRRRAPTARRRRTRSPSRSCWPA